MNKIYITEPNDIGKLIENKEKHVKVYINKTLSKEIFDTIVDYCLRLKYRVDGMPLLEININPIKLNYYINKQRYNSKKAKKRVIKIINKIRSTLGNKILTIYLKGSVALRNWHPKWSDIDFLVLTKLPVKSLEMPYFENCSLDFLSESELKLSECAFKLGDFRDPFAILQLLQYAIPLFGKNFLVDIKPKRISFERIFDFFQYYYFCLRRLTREIYNKNMDLKNLKSKTKQAIKFCFLMSKRAVNIFDEKELMPYFENVYTSVIRYYPEINCEALKNSIICKEFWEFATKESLLNILYQNMSFAEEFYYQIIRNFETIKAVAK